MIWIWNKNQDTYIECKQTFTLTNTQAKLKISADRGYFAYVNGKFASNGQYADVPDFKSVNEVDISHLVQEGENELIVTACHFDRDFSAAHTMTAAVAFEIYSDGACVAKSGKDTLCRKHPHYRLGDVITAQIGYASEYDFTACKGAWEPAQVIDVPYNEVKRPIKDLVISKPIEAEITAQGAFVYNGGNTAAEKMYEAYLKTVPFAVCNEYKGATKRIDDSWKHFAVQDGDGVFILVDLGRESVGHLSFSIQTDCDCNAIIGWGEHLKDLRVRSTIDFRNFATNFRLKKGVNEFDGYLSRLGCRYLCLFVESRCIQLQRLTLRPTDYPFHDISRTFGDRLLDKIYDVAKRSLVLCAHEHYEDCPWREQALYGMDSRNQMLFGYYAFEEYDYPRQNLLLFAHSLREDGFVELCAPSRCAFTIPSFSAYWLLAIAENVQFDYNQAFIQEILPYAEKTLGAFASRITPTGVQMIKEVGYWNFHEWTLGLDGGDFNRTYELEAKTDLILTSLCIQVFQRFADIEKAEGNFAKADEYAAYAKQLLSTVECFYNKENGLYASYLKDGELQGYHQYTQAAALLSGGVPAERHARLFACLKDKEDGVVALSFAALQFKYEALMMDEDNLDYCVDDLCRLYGKMLFEGATSFYETEEGEADFNNAGSLCHGWSSVACYLFVKYLKRN